MMDGVNDNGEATMEKAATDIYTFENLRKNGYTYIDKTAILKHLADDSRGRQFFIDGKHGGVLYSPQYTKYPNCAVSLAFIFGGCLRTRTCGKITL